MSKKLTITFFALLALCADILIFRQTLLARQELGSNSFLILLSQIFIALVLIACVLLFARKVRFKQS